jgi:tRNA A-37 threonylcarbamoyl transferase component Bud32/tetratricopeptide (TPR) repeat protein
VADDRPSLANEEARRSALATAQTLEKRGLLDAALQAFQAAGATEDVARILLGQRRFADAGKVLLDSLGVAPDKVGALDAAKRKLALQAAICFGRSGEATLAATLFVSLGEKDRAVDVLKRAGDHIAAARVLGGGALRADRLAGAAVTTGSQTQMTPLIAQTLEANGKFDLALDAYVQLRQPQNAGRMAYKLGRFAQAAEFLVTAGLQYEASECFAQAGDAPRGLDAAVRVPRDHPRYRQAALLAVRLANELNALDFQLDHFLTKFISEPPQSEREAEALYVMGKLYQRHDHQENAKDAYRKLLSAYPMYRDARALLDAIEAEARGSAMVYEKILREEQAFRGEPARRGATLDPSLPDLPELPPLPGLPELPSWAATMASIPSSLRSGAPTPRPQAPTPPPRAYQSVTVPPPASHPPAPTTPVVAPAVNAETLLQPGNIVADRYKLEAKIGQGGMAAVFRALDLELNEQIALKVFTQRVDDESLVARFKQELTLSRQLHHPNIIRLYDIGAVHGFRYITMELLNGRDLKSSLGAPLDAATGIGLLLQCCSALQHVHEKGVVHRDIKPANLFLTNDGVVKLMDFGIAKRQSNPGLTVAGMIAGTPDYMSPEQISGFEKVTASTDLYALGIMAYEMFTGAVPFRHPELMPLLLMQLNDLPAPPRAQNPAIPPVLDAIILKLLEKNPANRYASCRDLTVALQSVGRR